MKTLKATAFAVLVMASSVGCGKLEFTQNPLEDIPIVVQKAKVEGLEIVSGANVGQTTVLSGYKVDASVGAIRNQVNNVTPNGYTIYHGVKGAIYSDESTQQ